MEIDMQCLKAWLNISFYKEKCTKHPKQHKTACCLVCMQEPVCELCWRKEERHHQPHHPILHVCISSWRTAVKETEIKRLLDVSKIQDYTINKGSVVYLNPNQESSCGTKSRPLKCQICTRKLKDSGFQFCSIACKVKSMETLELEKTQLPTLKRKMDDGCLSLRKRSRKGIPQRAPLQ